MNEHCISACISEVGYFNIGIAQVAVIRDAKDTFVVYKLKKSLRKLNYVSAILAGYQVNVKVERDE